MSTRPPIVLSTVDADRLERLLESLSATTVPGMLELQAELARAELVEPEQVPADVVTMNSTVRFTVENAAQDFQLTLVYPKDIDGSAGRISVLAPVGSALLGLKQGDRIDWPGPGGSLLRVRIAEVVYQPERAGAFHR